MTSSTKPKDQEHETLEKILLDNDFFEIAIREEQERLKRARLALEEANRPKINEEDLAQAESTGYAQGLADGKQQATEALRGELNQHLARLIERLEYLDAIKRDYLRITYTAAFKLLMKMFDHLFRDISTAYTEEVLAHALETCLNQAVADVPLVIRLNPSTLDYARKIATYNEKMQAFGERIRFVADPNITAGDCLLEWDAAGVDMRLAHAVDGLRKLLAAKLAGVQREEIDLPPEASAPTASVDITTENMAPQTEDDAALEEEITAALEEAPLDGDDMPEVHTDNPHPDAFEITEESDEEKP